MSTDAEPTVPIHPGTDAGKTQPSSNAQPRVSQAAFWPWWSILSLVLLMCLLAAATWIGLALVTQPVSSNQWPTPVLLVITSQSPPALPDAMHTALGQQFQLGAMVQVTGTSGLDLRVRAGPGTLYETVQLISEGTRLEITGAAQYVKDQWWWPVRNPADGLQGWVVAEYLKPVAP